MREIEALSEFIASLTFSSLPDEVVERAQEVVRDTIGVIIGGMSEPEVSALADHAARSAPGAVTLLGHGGQTTPQQAVFVHGTAGTSLEMDEGHAYARGHAAIHALPPALALAEGHNAGGARALVAFVAGYEVAARAGIATRLRSEVHPFGAWGVLGAAAVAAWFKGFNPAQIAGTLELAASYAITPGFDAAFQGANVRNTFAGLINQNGLLAADMYQLSFRGQKGALHTTFGQILGQSFDPSALTDELGDRYEIMRGYFKPYSACRYTHAAVDAILSLRHDVDPSTVTSVDVETYDIATTLNDRQPATPLAGRFSLPYVVAATLLRGDAGPEVFRPAVLQDRAVRRLAQRVTVREEPQFTAMTPARRPARVRLHLADGTQREATVTGSKGDPDQPMREAELEAKFHSLTESRLGPERAVAAWNALGRLAQLPQLTELTQLLVPKGNSATEERR